MKLLGEKKPPTKKAPVQLHPHRVREREREGTKTEIKENGYDNSDNGSLDRK